MSRRIREHILQRLVPFERTPSGRPRNYVDPITGALYSARQRQQGHSGVSIETQKLIRDSGHAKAFERAVKRGESVSGLLRDMQRAAKREGRNYSRNEIAKSASFWRDVNALKRGSVKRVQALVNLGVLSPAEGQAIAEKYEDDATIDAPDFEL